MHSPGRTRKPASNDARKAWHTVQFYDDVDERALRRNVANYLHDGLARGEYCLVVATPAHSEGFCSHLAEQGTDLPRLRSQGRLMLLDADAALKTFIINDMPNPERFSISIGGRVRSLAANAHGAPVRIYGEMVGILWKAHQCSAAAALEELWNALAEELAFTLYCAYPIDVFGPNFHTESIEPVVRAHERVVSFGNDAGIVESVDRAIGDVLGSKCEVVRHLIRESHRTNQAAVPPGEATILWLRHNLREYANEILDRAKQHYAELPNIATTYERA